MIMEIGYFPMINLKNHPKLWQLYLLRPIGGMFGYDRRNDMIPVTIGWCWFCGKNNGELFMLDNVLPNGWGTIAHKLCAVPVEDNVWWGE